MAKVAFLFSGQGSQYVGMGRSLYEESEKAKTMFDVANELLPFDLAALCFEETDGLLNQTTYTQPAIFTMSAICLELLRDSGITPDVVAGFSLGEYGALYAVNVFSYTEGVKLVAKRGELMGACTATGKMAAILGLDETKLSEVCLAASSKGVVELANLNCPGQIVIGGEVEAVTYACELAKEAGAKRALPLPVSGPFHTSLLKETAIEFGNHLATLNLEQPTKDIVLNVLGEKYQESLPLKELMVKQMASSVKWEASIRCMIADGIDTFIEIGPGKTLSGFVKKIDRTVTVLNVEDMKSLEATIEAINAKNQVA